jgi:c-di-GMP-binding flagellar brake protein YcgR
VVLSEYFHYCLPHNQARILNVTEANMPNAKKRNDDAPVELINGDRRCNHRYDIPLDLRWKRLRRGKVLEFGAGTTIDLSSGGILFRAERSLTSGDRIELSVAWPALADTQPRLQLIVSGIVVRSIGKLNAIRMLQHEFRRVGVAHNNSAAEGQSKVLAISAH